MIVDHLIEDPFPHFFQLQSTQIKLWKDEQILRFLFNVNLLLYRVLFFLL